MPTSGESLERDADEEMLLHIELWKQEFRTRGMSDAEASAEAHRRFGDERSYREYAARRAARKAWLSRILEWLTEWKQDLRFALRHFGKTPSFTALAILTLALGIGANTAIFSVVHRMLIAPLPYPNGGRVVALRLKGFGGGNFVGLASMSTDKPFDPPQRVLRAWRDRAHAFDMIAGARQEFLALDANDRQDTVSHARITPNFLQLLGARPALGRDFAPDDERAANGNVAMISYGWWQRAFGGRGDALCRTMSYEGQTYTIIGVMPPGMSLPMTPRALDALSMPSPDMWIPASVDSVDMAFGRLRPGVTATEATRELQAITSSMGPVGPRFGMVRDSVRALALRAQDFLAPREIRTVEVLFAAVGALLLIACANVANLLLVRAWSRRREFAVRMGLGAGRARLVRLALTESVLIALIAGVLGVVIAWQGLRIIIAARPLALDNLATVSIEPVVLFWTAAISILTGLLFGGAAAFFVSSQNVADLLRNESRSATGAGISRRLRSSLIVVEIALSFALLVAAGLLTRSFAALQKTPMGFEPHGLVSIDLLVGPKIRRAGKAHEYYDAVATRLATVPGVTSVGIGTLPTAGFRSEDDLVVATSDGERSLGVAQHLGTFINRDYFKATGIAIVAGRLPNSGASDAPPGGPGLPPPPGAQTAMSFRTMSEEVVISRTLARRIAPDGNAIGTRIRAVPRQTGRMRISEAWSTVVGIAEDVRLPGAGGDLAEYQTYTLPLTRMPDPAYVLRFASVPPDVESVLRHAIQTVDPTLIARRARIADDYVREAMAPTKFTLALLGVFALVALVLAAVGLYGSIAYTVSQRTREIGIRVALGASPREVMRFIIRDGMRLVAAGLVIGVATAAAATRALTSLLYAVQAGDPATFGAIGLTVAVIAFVASCVPARRAVRIDPVDALRAD
jgi:predicted permease